MNLITDNIYVADFETTVYDDQADAEVWAAGLSRLYTEDCTIDNSVEKFFRRLWSLPENKVVIYFHNLKFDGEFILAYLMNVLRFKPSVYKINDIDYKFNDLSDLKSKEFICLISSMRQWYYIQVKYRGKIIEFRDSYKLLPLNLRAIGKAFATKHQKLNIEYTGFRTPGQEIKENEKEYLKNDLLVLNEALQYCFAKNMTKLTIGSNCMHMYKSLVNKDDYKDYFSTVQLENDILPTGEKLYTYIRKSYRGGWSYVCEAKREKIYHNGITVDANSLYPSVMYSESGNYYPVGHGYYGQGKPLQKFESERYYYFVRVRCAFRLRDGYLPTLSIKDNFLYPPREYLKSSDILIDGEYVAYNRLQDGSRERITVVLTLTKTDLQLMLQHYNFEYLEYIDYVVYNAEIGLFDDYIDYWREIKENSTGAMRTIAKLYSNNLYGRFAMNDNSSFEIPTIENNRIKLKYQCEHEKQIGYIPVGAAVTAYARYCTITKAQANYYGDDKPGFIYADTDSLHMDISEEKIRNVPLDNKKYQFWKIEKRWDTGWFVRSKTYIEIDKDDYSITCAGMPENCKNMTKRALLGIKPCKRERDKYTEEEIKFMRKPIELTEFKEGFRVPGKLMPKHYPSGIALKPVEFTIN